MIRSNMVTLVESQKKLFSNIAQIEQAIQRLEQQDTRLGATPVRHNGFASTPLFRSPSVPEVAVVPVPSKDADSYGSGILNRSGQEDFQVRNLLIGLLLVLNCSLAGHSTSCPTFADWHS
jgi:hypothetical protein